jgi:HTH-type transcriptional regulator, competence development regulator
MALGKRVRRLREERFLSPSELAEKAGISRNTLYRIESGQFAAYPKTVRKLAEALGVEPTDLVTMEELRTARGNAQAA